jgi:uridylate kinase
MSAPRYSRIVLKLSGEALMGDQSFGIAADMLAYVAAEIKAAHRRTGH